MDSSPAVEQVPGLVEQCFDLETLRFQLAEVDGDGAFQGRALEILVLFPVFACGFLVGGPCFEDVVELVEAPLPAGELFLGETPVADVVDQRLELLLAALEGAHQGVGGAGEAPLENAHRQAGGRPVQYPCPVVVEADVLRRLVVEFLLAFRSLGKGVAQSVAVSLRIERRLVEMNHLLLGPADEVRMPGFRGKLTEGVVRRERLRQQQSPQEVVGVILAHVRGCRQQQQMLGRPGKLPALTVHLGAGQGFRQLVPVRLAHPEIRLAIR